MLLALALLLFVAHIVAWMVLPASAANADGATPAADFAPRVRTAVSKA